MILYVWGWLVMSLVVLQRHLIQSHDQVKRVTQYKKIKK